ncbi:MAG: UDP-N-acetylmuramate dehydrogenase [Candidatus Aminicenantes bacterium]|nr:UDP-N-acetylmuramate dehydrogenase [Candidatus Aminicenantes bacterium]
MSDGKQDFPVCFLENMGKHLKKSVPLRDYSNFKIGGKADYFFEAVSITELVKSILLARERSFPYFIIGGGYNILFDDEGFRGLIIRNCVQGIKQIGEKAEIEVLAGTRLEDLINFSIDKGLSGFEFLAGIPGTVGGAVFSNAGAFGHSIGKFLKDAEILNRKGKRVKVKRDYFEFRYRHSILSKQNDVFLRAVFKLQQGEKGEIKSRIEENLEKRKINHPPWDAAYAGSYFKNPVLPDGRRVPAAHFLDEVGAKNMKVGGAVVYGGHANFIINKEKASAQDVLSLAQELKERVKERFGVDLEEEVIFLPAGSSTP